MSSHERVNILMVDDQPGKLLSYEVILGDLGENLLKATSAREALELLLKKEHPPRVAILAPEAALSLSAQGFRVERIEALDFFPTSRPTLSFFRADTRPAVLGDREDEQELLEVGPVVLVVPLGPKQA